MNQRNKFSASILSGLFTAVAAIMAIMFLTVAFGCGGNANSSGGPASVASTPGAAAGGVTAPGRPVLPGESLNLNPAPPEHPVRLVFIHHSVGEDWLVDSKGGLGTALKDNNYFVSDLGYGLGPADKDVGDERIGDHTDIGHWYNWFVGPNRDTYMKAVYLEDGGNTMDSYKRIETEPPGENEIVMFKSCYPNSLLGGSPDDPPATEQNLLRGQGSGEAVHTVQNAKGIYNDLLGYFRTRQDKLFVVITAPPNVTGEATTQQAANARALNKWLAEDWLKDYPYRNVAVFDFYDVLTSNGGSPEINDAGSNTGNHHRYDSASGTIEYILDQGSNLAAYGVSDDSHPTAVGLQKATAEFVPLLNIYYHNWKGA